MERPKKSKQVDAGGGIVFRISGGKTEVLLIKRRGVWDLPKGHLESGETPEQGACREVEEETGCKQTVVVKPLGHTIHFYTEGGTTIRKKTWWYVMQADTSDLKPQQEEDIEAIRWCTPGKAVDSLGYSNLKNLMKTFQEMRI
ncbi:NUDIX hydrolase [Balneolaceae bacterium ANBcel3]|nr:NUDIX hydrolase [Balneolaceae bacterium ANBcel3]